MPDDGNADDARDRRSFLATGITGATGVLGVMATYPVVRFLSPRNNTGEQVATAGEAETFLAGTSRTVLLDGRPILVIRLEDGSFRAFSALCTHLQCVVEYAETRKRIECPCHRGVYSLEGQNIAGPPPSPLRALAVEVTKGVVTIREV